MRISDLDISSDLKAFYLSTGIDELYPPQAEAVEAGLLDGNNILAAIPTASGKTMLAELAMLSAVSRGGKALYIVPLRALADEKYERFRMFRDIEIKEGGVKVGISTGDFQTRDDWLGVNDIIVSTSEKTDSLMRSGAEWMSKITTIVVDEVHLLDSASRGPTLEVTLTKLMHLNPGCQVVALSATIGNAYEIADWLDARLVYSDWRPTSLKEGVYLDGRLYFRGSHPVPIARCCGDDATNIVLDTVTTGAQSIVFNSTRRSCVAFARTCGESVSKCLSNADVTGLNFLADEVLDSGDVDTSSELADCIRCGTAFHHAGLSSAHRRIVENGFRDNVIKVVSCTPTLAAGLNLPARRVVIRSYKRYVGDAGMKAIPVFDYKQMAGRAGRPHLDPYGESVLLAMSDKELSVLFDSYVNSDAEDVYSKLGSEVLLRTHVLSTLANGFASGRQDLLRFFGATFFAFQNNEWDMADVIDECIVFLIDAGMILGDGDSFSVTELGHLVSTLYIDPLSAFYVCEGLKQDCDMTELTIIHLMCRASEVRKLYLRAGDWDILDGFVKVHSGSFVNVPLKSSELDYEFFLAEVKTSLFILDWIAEMPAAELIKKYRIGEGDLHSYIEIASWIMHSVDMISFTLGNMRAHEISSMLVKRIEYGISPELVELLSVHGIGRVRARKLYDAGICGISDIAVTDKDVLADIVGPKVAANAIRWVMSV